MRARTGIQSGDRAWGHSVDDERDMAYVIVTAGGEELDRRELLRCTVIGRSPECDLPIRDILLSRRHCKIEQTRDGWVLLDLDSKNGTYLAREKVVRHAIEDGDLVKIGRTTISFHIGPFVPAAPGTPKRKIVRPTDPNESLESTVAGFTLKEEDAGEATALPAPAAAAPMMTFELADHHPRPHPGPPVPRSYITEGIHEMLQEMASDMWDAVASAQPRPRVSGKRLPKPRPRPKNPSDRRGAPDDADLSLQVGVDTLDVVKPWRESPGPSGTASASGPAWSTSRRRRRMVRPGFVMTVAIAALAVLLGGYLLTLQWENYASAGSITDDIDPRHAITRGSMPNE